MAVTAHATGTTTGIVTTRSVADGVTNTTTTITSATLAFVAGDVGRLITGSADLPAGAYIASVTNGTTALLNIAATGTHTGQTFTLGTEFVLTEVAVAGTFTLHVDTNTMAAVDVTELRVYQMVLTAGTRRVAYSAGYSDAQPTDDQIKISVPISNELTDAGSLRFTLKQTAGTGRAFPWKVLKYA